MTLRARLKRWVPIYAYVGLIVLAGFWMMDGVTVYHPPASAKSASASTASQTGARVFVLFIDSLRYETAISPEMMPHLSRLRDRSVWAEVKTSYNAVTVPSLRAAFTGRDEVSVLSFVQNFLHGNAAIESFFSQFAAAGFQTAVFSDGAFKQFGPAIKPSFDTALGIHSAGIEDYDDESVRRGIALFNEGKQQIVIVHVHYTDYSAHQYGVGTAGYRRDFQRADRLVALADEAIKEPDTLMVMGDHGHDLSGGHTLGQDVPTLALYRSPHFKRGFDLGLIAIMSHRWFLSEIFGMPLPAEGYMGGRYPAALAGAPVALSTGIDIVLPSAQTVSPLLWLYFALLIVLGAGLIWPERAPWMCARNAKLWVWLALPAAIFPLPWNGWLGAATSAGVFAWLLRKQGVRIWLFAAALILAALGWHEWGRLLATARDKIHETTFAQIAVFWLILGGVVAAVATRRNRRLLITLIGITLGFLALPTNYRYGFTGVMVPLLWLWLVAYVASLVREDRLHTRRNIDWATLSLLLIFGFTQALAGIESKHFVFRSFEPVVPWKPFDRGMFLWFTLVWGGLLAKILIFFPQWPRRLRVVFASIAIIGLLQAVEWRTWEPGAWGSVALTVALVAGWLGTRRRDPELAHIFALGLLFFLFVYCVRPVRENYARADFMLAGLMFAARWLRRFPQEENTASDYTVLGVVAFLAAGFFTMSWSIEKLEWSRIYTWFPAHWVEASAIMVVPWIVGKSALFVIVARTIISRELQGVAVWPGENMRRLVGFKLLTLLLVLTGLGMSGTVSNVYLEGAQQLAVLLILWAGLLF
jgi:hypothetical protein